MKKVWPVILAAVLVCLSVPVMAENTVAEFFKPIWLKAIEEMKEQQGDMQAAGEPYVVSVSEGFEVARGTLHLNAQYSNEAYAFAVLKNISDQTVRIFGVTVTLFDWNGKKLAKRDYASFSPEVILPGEMIYVHEWLYDFPGEIDAVGYAEIEIEESDYSRRQIEHYGEAHAYIEGDYLYAEWTNTSDTPAFDVTVIALVLSSDGEILDMLCENTYGGTGVKPGSTILFRRYLNEYAFEKTGVSFEAEGYRYIE